MTTAIRKTGRAYIVRNKQVWYGLPIEVRQTALKTINSLFRYANVQLMRVTPIDEGKVPPKIDFVDAVVRFYPDSKVASQAFHKLVSNQIDQLKGRFPELEGVMNLHYNKEFKIDIGRAFAVKGVCRTSTGQKHLVCISEAAISLESAFGTWAYMTHQPMTIMLSSLKTASSEKQKVFGRAFGRVIAHEIRHQLNTSGTGQGLGGYTGGLGKEESPYWNDIKFKEEDLRWIQTFLSGMAKEQGGKPTEPVSRN